MAPAPATPQQVPPHLAQLGAAVVDATLADLEARSGEEGRAWAARRAAEAIDRAGIRNWAAKDVRIGSLADIAEALGLDSDNAESRELIERLLAANSLEEIDAALSAMLEVRGEMVSEQKLGAIRQAYQSALTESYQGALRHVLALPDARDRIMFEWRPGLGEFHVRHDDEGDAWNAPVMTVLRGDLQPAVAEGGDAVQVTTKPAEKPVAVYSAADLRFLGTAIFRDWIDDRGNRWRIESPLVEGDETSAVPDDTGGPTRAEQIREKQRQIDELASSKAYVWENPESGEVVRQQRFRRLKDPWSYLGEQYAVEDAEARIEALQAEMDALSAGAGTLPVKQHDPIGYADAPAHAVSVTVSEPGGYVYSYDEARYDGRRVLARRTLRDERDIINLPAGVISQLIASWSPPEWIELEAELDPATGNPVVDGQRWRLHVTYSGAFGDVQSIHTPWARPITLRREERRAP